ncbi:THAP-type domain-containing protein [Aphis craccivora]|uniref:THAP-type domain-containing protein n=1 Tax=Aphis craccivora TaxID=307492 RepID=A0A6G0Y046_APHCR|nr:THAP-type domain-containing protein [Aphis craccivora]
MVVKCIVCPNKYGPLSQISFHRFPLCAERFKQWAMLCRQNDLIDVDPSYCNQHYKLCSRHFNQSQFAWTRLISNAVPSKFQWNGYLYDEQEIAANSCTGPDLLSIIFSTIHKLHSISLNVRVIISDLGSNLKNLVDTRHITLETPYFNVSGKEIVFMFDPPHLLKATRNYFFNYRFKSLNKVAEKIHLKEFYKLDKSQVHRLAPKLTDIHLNSNSFQKIRVKYASQIFSHTIVAGMTTLISISSKISDGNKIGSKRFCLPFTNSEDQTSFLNCMTNYFKHLKVQKFDALKNEWISINRQYNIKFINSWLISIAGLICLYSNSSNNDQEISNLEICTYRLNQDCLENFFGTVRTQNRNCINPTCIQFKRTFKKLFVMNYFEYSEGANCVKD